jgi:hypothetical protein
MKLLNPMPTQRLLKKVTRVVQLKMKRRTTSTPLLKRMTRSHLIVSPVLQLMALGPSTIEV